MSYATLSELKAHLRVNTSAEDTTLQLYIDSAEEAFKNLSGRTLDDDADTGFPDGVPVSIKLAILLLSAHFYRVRAAYTDQDVASMPFGFVSICRQYSTKFVSPGVV